MRDNLIAILVAASFSISFVDGFRCYKNAGAVYLAMTGPLYIIGAIYDRAILGNKCVGQP